MAVTTIAGNAAGITIIEASLTPAEVATITAPAQTFTVTGLKTGDAVFVTPPGQQAGVAICNAYVSAADTLSIQFVNPTAGNLTPTAGTHVITVIRKEGLTGAARVLT